MITLKQCADRAVHYKIHMSDVSYLISFIILYSIFFWEHQTDVLLGNLLRRFFSPAEHQEAVKSECVGGATLCGSQKVLKLLSLWINDFEFCHCFDYPVSIQELLLILTLRHQYIMYFKQVQTYLEWTNVGGIL